MMVLSPILQCPQPVYVSFIWEWYLFATSHELILVYKIDLVFPYINYSDGQLDICLA